MSQKKGNVFAIAIMYFLFFMIAFVTGLQNPMGIIAKAQFGASNAMSQLGNFMNFFAYAFLGIPAGLFLKKRGYKVTSLTAVGVGFCGVLVSFLSGVFGNYWVYLLGALISGFSMCMLNTVVNPMLNTLGGGGNRGNQLIQFGGSCNSIGATIVPWFAGILIGDVTAETSIKDVNPALFVAMGIFALAFVIILLSSIPEPELEAAKEAEERGEKTEVEGVLSSVKGALKHRNLLLGIIAIFVYIGVEVGIPNIANLYMTTGAAEGGLGLAAGIAGTFVGAYWFLMLVGRLIGGSIGARVSSKMMVSTVSIAGIAFLLLAIFLPSSLTITLFKAQVPVSILFMVLCGLCTSIMWGAIFNLSVEGLGKYTAIASGIFMTMVVGGGILPIVQGAVADALGFLNSYWLIIIYLVYILWFALIGSRVKKEA